MLITDKGQVTIPKHIRMAAGVAPGSEVSFSLEGSKIVITPVATGCAALGSLVPTRS
jgi:antitoxin PrlF